MMMTERYKSFLNQWSYKENYLFLDFIWNINCLWNIILKHKPHISMNIFTFAIPIFLNVRGSMISLNECIAKVM